MPRKRSRQAGLAGAIQRHPVLRSALPITVALAALAALIVSAEPTKVIGAARAFRLALVAPVLLLSISFYLLQGVRWWTLLRAGGIRIGLGDTVVLTLTGQATALLPLGEVSRSLLVARVTGAGAGSVLATETVQELFFVGILFVAGIPGAMRLPAALVAVAVATLAVALVVVCLTSDAIYLRVHRVVSRTPLLRRVTPGADELQRYWVKLLHQRATYSWLWISVLQAGVAVSLMWGIIQALDPGRVNWLAAALTYAVTQGVSWIALSPGGLGVFELSTAGFLVVLGVPYGVAAAAALLFRLADKGLATLVGVGTFPWIRRRFGITGGNVLRLRQSGGQSGRAEARSPS